MIKELKPCPKCGSDNGQTVGRVRLGTRFVSASDYFARCDDCGFVIRGYITGGAAIAAWNELERKESEGKRAAPHADKTAETSFIPEYVIREIETEYKKALKQPWVNKPLAYALYQVWKSHDRSEVSRY